jgi:serine/threonine-protein kinase
VAPPASASAAPTASAAASASAEPAGDTGTLVLVAIGGTCAFSVNGAPKGKVATLKLEVKPGAYNIACTPGRGAPKTKVVNVQKGGTSTATFKL